MAKEIRVKLDLSYQDAHTLTIMAQNRGHPHILEQLNEATTKAAKFSFWDLVKHDFKHKEWRMLLSRFKYLVAANFK